MVGLGPDFMHGSAIQTDILVHEVVWPTEDFSQVPLSCVNGFKKITGLLNIAGGLIQRD